MKNFLAVFTGTAEAMERSGWNSLSEPMRQERTQAGIKAWKAWEQTNEGRIVVSGGPIGKTQRVSAAGVEKAKNNICGYVVVSAESHEAASRLFEGHRGCLNFCVRGAERLFHGGGRRLRRTDRRGGKVGAHSTQRFW